MMGRLRVGVLVTLVAPMFILGVTQIAYANDDPIWVGPKTFTGNQAQTQSQPETLLTDPTTALTSKVIR